MIYLVIIIMILHLTHNVSWFPLPSTTNVYTRITTGMNTNSWTNTSMDTTTPFYRWWSWVFRDSVSNIFISTYSNRKLNQEQQTKDIILRRYISIIRVLQWFFNIGGRFNNALISIYGNQYLIPHQEVYSHQDHLSVFQMSLF